MKWKKPATVSGEGSTQQRLSSSSLQGRQVAETSAADSKPVKKKSNVMSRLIHAAKEKDRGAESDSGTRATELESGARLQKRSTREREKRRHVVENTAISSAATQEALKPKLFKTPPAGPPNSQLSSKKVKAGSRTANTVVPRLELRQIRDKTPFHGSGTLQWQWASMSQSFTFCQHWRTGPKTSGIAVFAAIESKSAAQLVPDIHRYQDFATSNEDCFDRLRKICNFKTVLILTTASAASGSVPKRASSLLSKMQEARISPKDVCVMDGDLVTFLEKYPCATLLQSSNKVSQEFAGVYELIPVSSGAQREPVLKCNHKYGSFRLYLGHCGYIAADNIFPMLSRLGVQVVVVLTSRKLPITSTPGCRVVQLTSLLNEATVSPRVPLELRQIEACMAAADEVHSCMLKKKGVLLIDDDPHCFHSVTAAMWTLIECGNPFETTLAFVQTKLPVVPPLDAYRSVVLSKLAESVRSGQVENKTTTSSELQLTEADLTRCREICVTHARAFLNLEEAAGATNNDPPVRLAAGVSSVPGSPTDQALLLSAPVDPMEPLMRAVRKSMSKVEYVECLNTLTKIMDNILAHPQEGKFRILKLKNPKFYGSLGRHSQAMQILYFVGFIKSEDSSSIELPLSFPLERIRHARAYFDT